MSTATDRWAARLRNLAGLIKRPRPEVAITPASVVHTENKLRLLRYHARPQGLAFARPVLLVPSLINRHYVLDLMPEKSLVQWLVARGHDVWCIDWGTPGPEDRYLTFDEIVGRYLGRCVRIAARTGGSGEGGSGRGGAGKGGGGKVHLLGYCMGGIFTAAYTAVRPQHVATLTSLAAPVSFSDDSLLSRWTRSPGFDVEALVQGTGLVPWQLLQGTFHMLRPTLSLSKAMGVIDRAWSDPFLDGFLALETWANDNVALPGAFFRTYISDLYRADGLVNGTLLLLGERVDLGRIVCPALTVAFSHDTIAPFESCAALHRRVGSADKELVPLPGSHVGGVVSRRASQGLWPQLSDFWARRD